MKFNILEFDGQFEACIGKPEKSGVWIIWGHSANGKTRFSLQLAKYMCRFGRVLYNTLEEGARQSFKLAVEETGMKQVSRKFQILDRESIEDLRVRLRRHKSPSIIFIDSFQYAQLSYPEYLTLKTEFPNKLFVFVSHADGRHPSGRTAKTVRYDADVKIMVEGYKAFPNSRYGGGEPYVIWPERAAEHHDS